MMTSEEYEWHLAAGRIYGREATCGSKVDYGSEYRAVDVAEKMTAKHEGRKVLEAYPCAWCSGWHVGRAMTEPEWVEIRKKVDGRA